MKQTKCFPKEQAKAFAHVASWYTCSYCFCFKLGHVKESTCGVGFELYIVSNFGYIIYNQGYQSTKSS